MRLNRTLGIAALVFGLAATTACGADEKEATVKEKATDSSTIVEHEEVEADEVEEVAEGKPAADSSTAQLGDTVVLGDWEVTVTKVQTNAGAAIKQANEFNEDAKGQYVLATYEATYAGSERKADATFDLTWSFTGSDNQVYETSWAVNPGDEWPSEARSGGTVKQQVSFDIPKRVIKGGTLGVETMDSDFETVYADFLVN